jgi:hypothetical protein
MNKRIDLTQLDGLYVYQDTLDFMQTSYRGAFGALATAFGSKLILHGVQEAAGSVSDGWVIIDGELMPFAGGLSAPQVVVDDIPGDELFADGSTKTVYFTRRARLANTGGFPFTDLRKFKTDLLTINDSDVLASAKAVKQLNDNLLAVVGFENAIILQGCLVDNVIGGNLDISSGIIKMDTSFISAPAYSGAFPVYLQANGTYTTIQPGAGTYITFDPYTSQRYADVLERATTKQGAIKMFNTYLDRFDNNGIGKWEMLGFKICDLMAGRVMVGYDRRISDPADGVWDASYNNLWNGTGGIKQVTLTDAQQATSGITKHAGAGGFIEGYVGGNAPGTDNFDPKRGYNAPEGAQPHENRQPYRVVLMVEKI